jgi:hypothetical protein
MSDEELDLVAVGETPPPDKPDTETKEEPRLPHPT